MSSRMDKYYKEKKGDKAESRAHRNQGMYNQIPDDPYENLNLTSNISVIKTDGRMDIDSIKEILNEKYDKRANKNAQLDDLDETEYEEVDENTKEYDLKKVIETAHKNKVPNYDRERFEHLRETQYDILNSLNIHDEEREKKAVALSEEEETLINLIKTVNENAERNLAKKVGGLLDDLIGSDDTEILEPIILDKEPEVVEAVSVEEDAEPDKKPTIVEELEKTKQLSRKDIEEELAKTEDVEVKESTEETSENKTTLSKTEELSNSFYTGSYHINKKDLEDFSDLEKEMNGGSLIVKILLVIIVLVTIAIGLYLLNKYLNLGLF